MQTTRASTTALATSLIRAVHARCDADPLLVDPYGDRLLDDDDRALWLDRFLAMLAPDVRRRLEASRERAGALDEVVRSNPAYGAVVVRQRYAEDRLAAAVARGITQYLVLGAGLDTFALRHPELAGRLRVFEVDHPASQASKRERLARAGIPLPSNVELVPADLESTPLSQALADSGHVATKPSFVAVLGLTQYLTFDANLALFRDIAAGTARGSEVVFDYLESAALEAGASDPAMRRVADERAASDEPWRSGFVAEQLALDLDRCGLAVLEDLGARELGARYRAGRARDLTIAAHVHVAAAAHGASSPR